MESLNNLHYGSSVVVSQSVVSSRTVIRDNGALCSMNKLLLLLLSTASSLTGPVEKNADSPSLN